MTVTKMKNYINIHTIFQQYHDEIKIISALFVHIKTILAGGGERANPGTLLPATELHLSSRTSKSSSRTSKSISVWLFLAMIGGCF